MARPKAIAGPKKKQARKKSTGIAKISKAEWGKSISREGKEKREAEMGGDSISIRNKKFTFKGKNLGTKLEVIILDFCFLRTWFDQPYDSDNPSIPACYSLQYEAIDVKPAENSVVPQCETTCDDCEYDAWGSDEKRDGKACKEKRHLLCLSAENNLEKAAVGTLDVPSGSLKDWKKLVSDVEDGLGRELYSVIVEISFDEDSDFVALNFKVVDSIDSADDGAIILAKRDEYHKQMLTGYDPAGYIDPSKKRKTKTKPKPKSRTKKAAPKKGRRRA